MEREKPFSATLTCPLVSYVSQLGTPVIYLFIIIAIKIYLENKNYIIKNKI